MVVGGSSSSSGEQTTSLAGTWGEEQRKQYLFTNTFSNHNSTANTGANSRGNSPSKQQQFRANSSLSASRENLLKDKERFMTVSHSTFTGEVFAKSRDPLPTKHHKFVSTFSLLYLSLSSLPLSLSFSLSLSLFLSLSLSLSLSHTHTLSLSTFLLFVCSRITHASLCSQKALQQTGAAVLAGQVYEGVDNYGFTTQNLIEEGLKPVEPKINTTHRDSYKAFNLGGSSHHGEMSSTGFEPLEEQASNVDLSRTNSKLVSFLFLFFDFCS
jgi:hypothetical protein